MEPQQRKVRSDKLHDIKIPVDETVDTFCAVNPGDTGTALKHLWERKYYCSDLKQIFVYPDVTYKDSPLYGSLQGRPRSLSKAWGFGHRMEMQCSKSSSPGISWNHLRKNSSGDNRWGNIAGLTC